MNLSKLVSMSCMLALAAAFNTHALAEQTEDASAFKQELNDYLAKKAREADEKAWQSIKGSRKAADFKAYLVKYPKGAYAKDAKTRLMALNPPARPKPESASASQPQPQASAASQRAEATASVPAAEAQLIANRYQPLGDGAEIKDTQTGLIWQRCALGMRWSGRTCLNSEEDNVRVRVIPGMGLEETYIWITANFDEAYDLAVKSNRWRVPDKDELSGIVDKAQKRPAINREAFPKTPPTVFWSSSHDGFNAWGVNFNDGVVHNGLRFNRHAVRLVRSSQ